MNPATVSAEEQTPKAKGWSRTSWELLAFYENKLLSHLTVPYKSYQVSLQTDKPELKALTKDHLNTLEILGDQRATQAIKTPPNLVVIHGAVISFCLILTVLR
jgi:hypothetical protein